MGSRQRCVRRNLSATGGCRVDLCSHGTVHVAVGDVTLRLHRDGFCALAESLARASARLRHADEKPAYLC